MGKLEWRRWLKSGFTSGGISIGYHVVNQGPESPAWWNLIPSPQKQVLLQWRAAPGTYPLWDWEPPADRQASPFQMNFLCLYEVSSERLLWALQRVRPHLIPLQSHITIMIKNYMQWSSSRQHSLSQLPVLVEMVSICTVCVVATSKNMAITQWEYS